MFRSTILLLVAGALPACATHPPYDPGGEEKLTVATAQQEIRLGMSGGEVATALGSPNVISTDADHNEVWMYDKIATQVLRSDTSAGIWVLLFGSSGGGLGGVNANQSTQTKSQRTLTIIIRFDGDNRVRDFAYHTSRF